jgi:large subunit ribosomal protein L29
MNAREVRSKEDKELKYDLKNLTKELFDLRFQSASENLSNPARIRQIKKDIARIHTIMNERAMGIRGASPK